MDNWNKFQNQIKKRIEKATDIERIQFGLDICNRLLPDYKIFELKDNWGDSNVLIEAIQFIDASKSSKTYDRKKHNLLIQKVDKIIPDTEDFSDWEVSYALNASVCVLELLSYLNDQDYNRIFDISTLMTDNVDFKIQMNNEGISDNEIDNHPMLLDEFKHQLELIK